MTLAYTDNMVANSVTSTTVTATATHAEASVNMLLGRTVSLPEGQAKTITVVVTAEDGVRNEDLHSDGDAVGCQV